MKAIVLTKIQSCNKQYNFFNMINDTVYMCISTNILIKHEIFMVTIFIYIICLNDINYAQYYIMSQTMTKQDINNKQTQ